MTDKKSSERFNDFRAKQLLINLKQHKLNRVHKQLIKKLTDQLAEDLLWEEEKYVAKLLKLIAERESLTPHLEPVT